MHTHVMSWGGLMVEAGILTRMRGLPWLVNSEGIFRGVGPAHTYSDLYSVVILLG